MHLVILFIFLYLILIIQTAFLPVAPDLVLLTLIVYAFYENRITATILGLFAGFFLDLTTPTNLGIQAVALGAISYGVTVARNLFYRTRWHTPIFAGIGLGLKHILLRITGNTVPAPVPIIIAFISTLFISLFIENVLQPLFYPWRKK